MRVDFKNSKNHTIGVAELGAGGKVRFRGPMAKTVRSTVITEPVTMKRLYPHLDGESYLRALPYTFRPPYFFAEVVDEK